MSRSIYLISPRSDFPSYYGAESLGAAGCGSVVNIADLALPTVAGLIPDGFDVRLCDENAATIDYDAQVDYVAITGKINQSRRMAKVAARFRARGRTVVIGGPYASLSPQAMRPHCDILVRGEIENLAPRLFADLHAGTWQDDYEGDRPEMAACALPRWSGYPNDQTLIATVQTSRGCPFECEFCDVIQYLGRRQRQKSPSMILAELDEVYRHGYRDVFLADDNFTVYRHWVKETLVAIRDWNRSRPVGAVSFFTQVSIDAAKDDELLRMCAEAGIVHVFIGIETPNQESLKETKKRQNVNVNLVDRIQRFLDHGIAVTGGMIVGFDADGLDIFERQRDFALSVPVPIFTLGALVAPEATPLHARLAEAGRLTGERTETAGLPWDTNIVPVTMTRDQLLAGIRMLSNELYSPEAFGERMTRFIEALGAPLSPRSKETKPLAPPRAVNFSFLKMADKLSTLGPAEAQMFARIRAALAKKPSARHFMLPLLAQYMQIRYMYEQGHFWDAHPGTAQIMPLSNQLGLVRS